MDRTLLLVDDHPLFRRGVRELILSQSKLYDHVLEADNGQEALDQIHRIRPGCVMLDIAMPGIDGLQTLELIKAKAPDTRCIIFSMYNNTEFVTGARNRGAQGYILKTDPDRIVLECLYNIMHGREYVSSSVGNSFEPIMPQALVTPNDLDRLSSREKEILSLIAKNQTSKEISKHLSVSIRTIQNHRANICKKLGISGSNTLLKLAIENQAWL
jgi:DNA-binding NarL/FixJ family response regulator